MKISNFKAFKALSLIGGVVLCSNPLLAEEIPCPENKDVVSKPGGAAVGAEPAVKKVRVKADDEVILSSSDSRCFVLKEDDAKQSQTIKNLIEDAGIDDPIPLPPIDGETLKIVVEILKKKEKSVADLIGKSFAYPPFTCWRDNQLVKLIFAGNYLDIPPILAAGTELLGKKIFGEDLEFLGSKSKIDYQQYRTCFLGLNKDIQRLMVQTVALTPIQLATFSDYSGYPMALTFSRDGTRVLTGSYDNTAKLWDANAQGDNNVPLATFRHDGLVKSVAFSRDGTRVLTGSEDERAKLWDANARGANIAPRATFRHDGEVYSIAFSPDGTRVLTGSNDDTAKLWDANAQGDNNVPLATFRHDDVVTSVAFSPDGTRVLTGSHDKTAKLWDANARGADIAPLAIFRHDDAHYDFALVETVAFSRDGTRVLTSSAEEDTASLWDANARGADIAPLATFGHDGEVHSIAFSPDGTRVLGGSGDKTAKLWDANAQGENDAPLATFRHDGEVYSIAFSPDGTRVLTGSADKTAKLWDANAQGDNNAPLATFRHDFLVISVAFSPDGTRVLTGSYDETAKLWAWFDARKLTNPLAEAQIMLFVQQNKLTEAKTPEHLVAELSPYAKNFLWGRGIDS